MCVTCVPHWALCVCERACVDTSPVHVVCPCLFANFRSRIHAPRVPASPRAPHPEPAPSERRAAPISHMSRAGQIAASRVICSSFAATFATARSKSCLLPSPNAICRRGGLERGSQCRARTEVSPFVHEGFRTPLF